MPRRRYPAPAQQPHRGTHSMVTVAEPAQKKRRLVHIGSPRPPFTTATQHLATRPRRHRHEESDSPRAASTSPNAIRKRRIVLIQRNNPLDLRCPSPLPPSRDQRATLGGAATAPAASQPDVPSNADNASRISRRNLLQRNAQLDFSVASSPIGTFGGLVVGRSGRSLRSSLAGSSKQASEARSARTVGLPPLNRPNRLRVERRAGQRQLPTSEAIAVHDENEALPDGKSSRRTTDDPLVKTRRRRTKIQRVQLGGGLPSSSAEQLLSDADRHLNSQPEAAEGVADESEISYFPTLRSARYMPASSDESQQGAAEHPILQTGPTITTTFASHELWARASGPQHVTVESAEPQQPEEGESSAGLLEVLSQSAIRKLDEVQAAYQSKDAVHSADSVEAQHQVRVDYDPSHFDEDQAQRIATLMVNSEIISKRWSFSHPDLISEQARSPMMRLHGSQRFLHFTYRPPSAGAVCVDLGLSSSQMHRTPLTDVPDFSHHRPADDHNDDHNDHNEGPLRPFEHGVRYAGYRQANNGRIRARCQMTELPFLQAFNEPVFNRRRQTRRKEVVKLIIPFSEPSLSAHATRARFVAPTPSPHSPPVQPHSKNDSVTLIWIHSTAHAFFRALESMVQAGFARSAQSCSSSHRSELVESDLYPCPILHYAAHAETGQRAVEKKASSHVALYVHLDRLEEARRKLADLELGDGTGEGYRPFGDASVRMVVTSLVGEPLCLI